MIFRERALLQIHTIVYALLFTSVLVCRLISVFVSLGYFGDHFSANVLDTHKYCPIVLTCQRHTHYTVSVTVLNILFISYTVTTLPINPGAVV